MIKGLMIKSINNKLISGFCVAIIIVLVFGKMELFHYYPDHSYGIDSYTMAENKRDGINDEIRITQTKLDSIQRVKRNCIDGFDVFNGSWGNFFGLIKLEQRNDGNKRKDNSEYLVLSKIGLKIQEMEGPNYLTFYTKNGDSYLSRTKLETKNKENVVSYVDQKVNYKYSSRENFILIPIKTAFWKHCIELFNFIVIAFTIIAYVFVLKSFFEVLIAISKNVIFEEENVNKLKRMAIILAVLGTYNCVFNLLIYLIFSINHSTNGVIITHSFWEHDYFLLIFSALCYLIFTTFKKAMILKQEQDLTI